MKTKPATPLCVVASALSALGLPACGPAAPANPTWENDIRPFVVARCIRCHDDPPRMDPAIADPKLVPAAYNFNYATAEQPLQAGLMVLQLLGAKSLRGEDVPRRMPPPPAEAVEDWQIEMLENWARNPR